MSLITDYDNPEIPGAGKKRGDRDRINKCAIALSQPPGGGTLMAQTSNYREFLIPPLCPLN